MSNSITYRPDADDVANIRANGKEIIRYCSDLNTWIDVVILVDPQYAEQARSNLERAICDYWDGDDLCYGDLIEEYFEFTETPYLAIYHDPNDETEEYEEAWEQYVKSLYEQKGE